MPKLDDDEDEKAWEQDSKFDGGGKEADEGDAAPKALPEVVQGFVHHVMSKRFRKAIFDFHTANARAFEDADVAEEQRLEWTPIFEQYVAMVEQLMEDFCAMKQTTAEEVFGAVRAVIASGGGALDDEFLPTALRITEYDHFVEQISLVANEARNKAIAGRGQEESKDAETTQGVWKLDGKASDLASLDDYIAAVGVPYVFRGLARGSLFTEKGLIITMDERSGSATVISDSTTGRRKETFVCDGQTHGVRNGWGVDAPTRASIGRDGSLEVVNEAPPSLPPRSTITTTYTPDGARMGCEIVVRNGATGRSARQALVYGRFSTPKPKGPAPNPPKSHK